jgi:hypothetical protein
MVYLSTGPVKKVETLRFHEFKPSSLLKAERLDILEVSTEEPS